MVNITKAIRNLQKQDTKDDIIRVQEIVDSIEAMVLMQEFRTDIITIQAFNVSKCTEFFVADYTVIVYDVETKSNRYAHFNSIPDMFFFYDTLINNFKDV